MSDYREKIFRDRVMLTCRVEEEKQAGKKIIFANGCFDLFHRGHLELLFWAKKQGDVLVVALNEDDIIRRLKGSRRPVYRLDDRMALIAGMACVDFVTSFGETTPIEIIQQLQPDVVVKGGDYREPTLLPEYDTVKSYGGDVRLCPYLEGYSSTKLLKWLSGNSYGRNNYVQNRTQSFSRSNGTYERRGFRSQDGQQFERTPAQRRDGVLHLRELQQPRSLQDDADENIR